MDYSKEFRDFIVSNFLFGDETPLQDDTSFLESGIIDSTGMLELIMFLEHKFGIRVEPEQMVPENLDSINCLVEFIMRTLA
jgi:acyl carrier protein